MRARTLRPLALAAAAVVLPGCLESDVATELKADGSGTFAMKLEFTEKFVSIVQKLRKLDPDKDPLKDAPGLITKTPDEATVAALKESGLEILELDSKFDETRLGLKARLGFRTLASLQGMSRLESGGASGKSSRGPGESMRLTRAADGVYTLSLKMESKPDSEEDSAEGDEGDEDAEAAEEPASPEEEQKKAAEAMTLALEMMGEASKLKMTFSLGVPGEIVSFAPAEAAKREDGKVTWTYDFATLMTLAMERRGAGGGSGGGLADSPFDEFQVRFRMPEGQSIPESALWNGPPAAPGAAPAEPKSGGAPAEPGGGR